MYVTLTGKRILVVSISARKTLKTPKREIDLALKRSKEIE
jgi:phage-related protein